MSFKEIIPQKAYKMMVTRRDISRYPREHAATYSHPQEAFHLTNQSFCNLKSEQDFTFSPIIVELLSRRE